MNGRAAAFRNAGPLQALAGALRQCAVTLEFSQLDSDLLQRIPRLGGGRRKLRASIPGQIFSASEESREMAGYGTQGVLTLCPTNHISMEGHC
jgi:hypothetical protein